MQPFLAWFLLHFVQSHILPLSFGISFIHLSSVMHTSACHMKCSQAPSSATLQGELTVIMFKTSCETHTGKGRNWGVREERTRMSSISWQTQHSLLQKLVFKINIYFDSFSADNVKWTVQQWLRDTSLGHSPRWTVPSCEVADINVKCSSAEIWESISSSAPKIKEVFIYARSGNSVLSKGPH